MTAAFPSAFAYTKRQSRNGDKPFDVCKDSAAKNAHIKRPPGFLRTIFLAKELFLFFFTFLCSNSQCQNGSHYKE